MKKSFFLFTPLFLCLFLLSGCGTQESKTQPKPSSNSSSNTSSQETGSTTQQEPSFEDNITVISDNDDWIISDVDLSDTNQPDLTGKTVDPSSISHIQGSGSYTLIEYSDTECHYSKEYHTTLDEVLPNYENEIQRGYKHFPLNQHIQKATLQAEATECAGDQNKFWEYTSEIYKRTNSNNSLPDTELFVIAEDLNLNTDKFNDCLAQATYNSLVKENSQEAQELGANGTPFSVLIDKDGNVVEIIDGMYSAAELEEIFDSYIN
ncbi:MAG: Periplasmic thiol:disulfide interchange protein DsbA [Candidatus Uhrbacteria bacterium GW2011_GWF2_39_13]|uniref:Periplasmic thiol:disulfide interchange protein DsbA n=1 Tax=Candidatus Uhrbacteria bacterium GW2011_GWF2_39_13 TaxID=1618995 RepID=A0A0G0Q284_9BACT|nr:MAG: Periplasmic thiol:disulfide interchange protein DsbA [Candidatus Uhrbacteria bacterium GW2011_GWF2_39_13]